MHIFVIVPFGERLLGQRDRIVSHFSLKHDLAINKVASWN